MPKSQNLHNFIYLNAKSHIHLQEALLQKIQTILYFQKFQWIHEIYNHIKALKPKIEGKRNDWGKSRLIQSLKYFFY